MKTMMMSFLNLHSVNLMLYLLIVHSLFFTCLLRDSTRDEALDDLNQLNSLPDSSRKQGVTHIPVTSDQVLQSDGEERFKWMHAGRKELDNLLGTNTVESISPATKEKIKAAAKAAGKKHIESHQRESLPSNLTSTKSGLLPVATRLMRFTVG